MARSKKMSKSMQVAAVRSALSGGETLDKIEKDYPNLKDGVDAVRKESAPTSPPPVRKGSGNTRALSSMTRRPTL